MTPTLPPLAYTVFTLAPKPDRAATIAIINRLVNNGIDPQRGTPSLSDPWQIAPRIGWCHDYAITKQWLLGALGIPSQLCECIAPDGELHMVLCVDDDVLDNLTEAVGPMRYQVARVQSAANPDDWEAA